MKPPSLFFFSFFFGFHYDLFLTYIHHRSETSELVSLKTPPLTLFWRVIGLFLNSLFLRSNPLQPTANVFAPALKLGAGCSTLAWAVIFPLDVVKSRAQAGGAQYITAHDSAKSAASSVTAAAHLPAAHVQHGTQLQGAQAQTHSLLSKPPPRTPAPPLNHLSSPMALSVCVREIYATAGMSGFYRGLPAGLCFFF